MLALNCLYIQTFLVQDYYPFGMVMPGRSFSSDTYNFSYQGSLKDNEIQGVNNTYSTYFRELDVRILRWWSLDPKNALTPWSSPYVSMAGNPIVNIDPMGDKEYKNIKEYRRKTGNEELGLGDWLKKDRINNGEQWQIASKHNLVTLLYEEYESISQRADFYKWFANEAKAQGHEISWAGAAAIVAYQMAALDNPLVQNIVGKEVVNFGNEGNREIFEDVFSKLSDVYKRGLKNNPIVGDEAKKFDVQTLYREQYVIVQPLYLKQSAATIETLSRMAKGEGIFGAGFMNKQELIFEGDILKPIDIYRHGMDKIVPFYIKYGFVKPTFVNLQGLAY